jgi:hypothetical protein
MHYQPYPKFVTSITGERLVVNSLEAFRALGKDWFEEAADAEAEAERRTKPVKKSGKPENGLE